MSTTQSGYSTTISVGPEALAAAGGHAGRAMAEREGMPSYALETVPAEATRRPWGLPRRLAVAAPAAPAARTARSAPPARPVSAADGAGEVAITLSLLAALLAAPDDPTGAGTLASPVQAALSGRLRRLLVPEEEGWHVALPDPAHAGGTPCPPGPQRAEVAPALAAAVLAPAVLPEGTAPDGWRLPELG